MTIFAGHKVTAAELNSHFGIGTHVDDTQNASRTTASTGYTPTLTGGVACAKAFIAPASGAVEIEWTMLGTVNVSTGFCYATPELKTGSVIGSGTIIFGPDDNDSANWHGTPQERRSAHKRVTGLTPGASYHVGIVHKVAGSGGPVGTWSRKHLSVRAA